MGRKPTKAKYKEGRDNGLTALLERMKRDRLPYTLRIEEVCIGGK